MLFSLLCLQSLRLTTDSEQPGAALRNPRGENASMSAFQLGACCQLELIFSSFSSALPLSNHIKKEIIPPTGLQRYVFFFFLFEMLSYICHFLAMQNPIQVFMNNKTRWHGRWGGRGWMNQESSTDIFTLPRVKQVASGMLPYIRGSSASAL